MAAFKHIGCLTNREAVKFDIASAIGKQLTIKPADISEGWLKEFEVSIPAAKRHKPMNWATGSRAT